MSPNPTVPSSTSPQLGNGLVREKPTLTHVGINVALDDFDAMIDWYRNVLDLDISFKGNWDDSQVCFLTNDDANHRIVFVANPAFEPDPAGPHARLGHTAYKFSTLEGLLGKYAALRDQGIHPYMSIDHGPSLSIYYMDPNRYGVELQVDAWDDPKKSSEFMRSSDDFKANVVGVLFDPDALIDAWNKGMTLAQVHESLYSDGAFPPTAEQRARLAIMGVPLRNLWDHPAWPNDHPTFAGL